MGILYKNITTTNSKVPTLELAPNDPEKVQAIIFYEDGKKYYFSNELGHKVISSSEERPMSKKEYNNIMKKMTEKTLENAEKPDEILDQLIQLDFGTGHANSTFQINRPCVGSEKIGALIFNVGSARYIYNTDGYNATVFHIDHGKNINGHFMPDGPDKDRIITTLTNSKTLQKKIAHQQAK